MKQKYYLCHPGAPCSADEALMDHWIDGIVDQIYADFEIPPAEMWQIVMDYCIADQSY